MDFKYHYTEEQERFRQEVSAWLDVNLPKEVRLNADPSSLDEDAWERCQNARRKLGEKGWLAPADPGHALVLRDELGRRELGWLLDEAATSLRSALHQWGTEEQRRSLLPLISGEHTTIWHPPIDPGVEPDTSTLGVQAFRDGDDYLLNGEGRFLGRGGRPDYLWTLALTDPDAPPRQSTALFLVPTGLPGIHIQTPRTLLQGETNRVTFDHVWVPPYCLLEEEGDGWHVMQATQSSQHATRVPAAQDEYVASLLEYVRETAQDGTSLSKEPSFRQLLAEAYINSQVTRLFRTRNVWMAATGQRLTYHAAQTALWEMHARLRLSQIAREIMGIYALLDQEDPRAPFRGKFELQQRQGLASLNPARAMDGHREIMAKWLRLGHGREDSVEPTRVSSA